METNDRDLLRERVLGDPRERAPALQWLGFFFSPLVFFAHLEIAYVLIPWACTMQREYWMHIVGAIAVLLSLAGVAAAWIARARTNDAEPHPRAHPVEGPGPLFRTRFMGDVGLGVGAMLTLILLMQWIGGFFITVCQ
jgi:hypothetical protein